MSSDRAEAAALKKRGLLDADWQVGDLIRMAFGEAHVLVPDALRQQVGGVPHACLLLAARTHYGCVVMVPSADQRDRYNLPW